MEDIYRVVRMGKKRLACAIAMSFCTLVGSENVTLSMYFVVYMHVAIPHNTRICLFLVDYKFLLNNVLFKLVIVASYIK